MGKNLSEISEIFEFNLDGLEKATLKPARFKDYDNAILWDQSYQSQMNNANHIRYALNTFSREFREIYDHLLHLTDIDKAYGNCVTMSENIAKHFSEGYDGLLKWTSEETGRWDRIKLKFSSDYRKKREDDAKSQVRQIFKMPTCYAAFIALVSSGCEFNQMLKEYQINLISVNQFDNLAYPPPFPFRQGLAVSPYRRGKVLPLVDPTLAIESLFSAGFIGELHRRADVDRESKIYGIELPLTFI